MSRAARLRWRFLLPAAGLVLCGAALARGPDVRLPPEERERLRHELREQGFEGRAPQWRDPPGYPGGRAPDAYDGQRPRMTPEERQQLRMLLRERHRERSEQRPRFGNGRR